jgi:hypothetical protein
MVSKKNKSNRKIIRKSNKQNRKSNRKISKKSNKKNNKKYFINTKELNKIGGFREESKIKNEFNKVLKNLETGKDSSHTNKVVENNKLVLIVASKFFKDFKNKTKKEKVANFDFYPYIIENNIELFSDCCTQLYAYKYPDNIVKLFEEVVKGPDENTRYNNYKKHFKQSSMLNCIFYIITSNILIKKLYEYIPFIINEPNKYLEIIIDTHNANYPKTGQKSLATTKPSSNASALSMKPLSNITMLPQKPLPELPSTQLPLNYQEPKQNHFNSLLKKINKPINSTNISSNISSNNMKNQKQNETNYNFGGMKKGGNNLNAEKIRNKKSITKDLFELYKEKITEPFILKDSSRYKSTLEESSAIKKRYLPGEYNDTGIDFLKLINSPEYDSKYVDELENKIYHSIREARKFLNIFLIENQFNKLYNNTIKLNANENNDDTIISSLDPYKFTEDVKNNKIFNNIKEKIISKYFNDNIKEFNESPYQFMDQNKLSSLGQITSQLNMVSNPLIGNSNFGAPPF